MSSVLLFNIHSKNVLVFGNKKAPRIGTSPATNDRNSLTYYSVTALFVPQISCNDNHCVLY